MVDNNYNRSEGLELIEVCNQKAARILGETEMSPLDRAGVW